MGELVFGAGVVIVLGVYFLLDAKRESREGKASDVNGSINAAIYIFVVGIIALVLTIIQMD